MPPRRRSFHFREWGIAAMSRGASRIVFGPTERPCVGWLHIPPADVRVRETGLVLCNPFGHEAICAYRSLRHFAHALAAQGIPSLRFDYDGTGNSAGSDRDPGRLNAWIS